MNRLSLKAMFVLLAVAFITLSAPSAHAGCWWHGRYYRHGHLWHGRVVFGPGPNWGPYYGPSVGYYGPYGPRPFYGPRFVVAFGGRWRHRCWF